MHHVLGEGLLCIKVKMEATAPASSTRAPASALSARCFGVGIDGYVVIFRHSVGSLVGRLQWFYRVYGCVVNVLCFVMVLVVRSVFIILWWNVEQLVRCIGRVLVGGEGPLVFVEVFFCDMSLCRLGRSSVYWYVLEFSRIIYIEFKFQVGLVVGVR